MNLIFLGARLQDFCECFIAETRNKTNENGKRQFLWNLLLRLIIRQCFAEFCWGGALGTNAQKLIKHQLILKKITLLG